MKQKKIRIVMVTNHFGITGIGTIIVNYCMALNQKKYDLTIIAGKPIAEQYKKICKEHKIKLISIPSRKEKTIEHYITLWKELRLGKFDIIHIHGNSSMMAIELTIAKFAGIKNRIAHSHNSICPNFKVHKLLNPYFKKIYTKALACGQLAGEWLFGENNFEILPNGFCTDKFIFSEKSREKIRKELSIENKYVIGHIGRINEQKNQEYLLQIFEQVILRKNDAVLLIIGTGPNFNKLYNLVKNSPYKDSIILYGETNEPFMFYSAMDIFVFPSKYEGLPVVLLEAQISGLPCIASDKISQEVDFGDINWCSINEDPFIWSNAIIKTKYNSNEFRAKYNIKYLKEILKYDINGTVKQLEDIYDNLKNN